MKNQELQVFASLQEPPPHTPWAFTHSFWGNHPLKQDSTSQFGIGHFLLQTKLNSQFLDLNYQYRDTPYPLPLVEYEYCRQELLTKDQLQIPLTSENTFPFELRILPTLSKKGVCFKLIHPLQLQSKLVVNFFIHIPLMLKITASTLPKPILEVMSQELRKTIHPLEHTPSWYWPTDHFFGLEKPNIFLPHKGVMEVQINNETMQTLTINQFHVSFANAALFSFVNGYFSSKLHLAFRTSTSAPLVTWSNNSQLHQLEHFLVQSSSRE